MDGKKSQIEERWKHLAMQAAGACSWDAAQGRQGPAPGPQLCEELPSLKCRADRGTFDPLNTQSAIDSFHLQA